MNENTIERRLERVEQDNQDLRTRLVKAERRGGG
jgi:hypothetical protein